MSNITLLPMQLRIGDRFVDEAGEWEVASHPASVHGGKTIAAKVRRRDVPATVVDKAWPAHERITVTRERLRRRSIDPKRPARRRRNHARVRRTDTTHAGSGEDTR